MQMNLKHYQIYQILKLQNWKICQAIDVTNAKTANIKAIRCH